jgi:recombination protein RecA
MKNIKRTLRQEILQSLGMVTFLKPSNKFLDLGDEEFNKVFGAPKGLPSGKLYEVAGPFHVGKTFLCCRMAALAQEQHNAFFIKIDLEGSDDRTWDKHLGVKRGSKFFYLIKPLVLKRKKDGAKGKQVKKAGIPFLQSIELVMDEAEAVMAYQKNKEPDTPIVLVVDSVANMVTDMVVTKGASGQNMRSALDRAQFLSTYLPKLCQLASNYDAWVFLINQIRSKQGMVFGEKEYTTGGNALEHNAHSRTWLKKLKGGSLLKNGQPIGIKAKAINKKNKTGYGSKAYCTRGYQVKWDVPIERAFKWMDIKQAEKDG